ncbi:HAD-IC family P-type ATPase [Limnoglobus roseus]|uniref:Magnesium-translocating P-type ATPase n=1 Tax=Limnoglobus roseus TaxID=2598579 RepID=A0A5C1AP25_9BACT|nr:HAD-IC family P-type ATPase [Limnoglobus roseus]QEL19893.1 magnesium-translocating P-type ATPase [Limnoglobus roseus]
MNRPPALHDGLSPAEVAERIAAGRVNRPPRDGWRAYADIARRNTLTLYNALVVPAAVGLFLLADYRAAWAVAAMAVANVALGLAHELRAKRHLDRLSVLGEARVRVRRAGTDVPLPAGDVVADDVVLLAAGDAVVADGSVVAAEFLELDEALLTGESDPVPKAVGDPVKSGSVCVAGGGAYRAERVGAAAFAHRMAAAARQYRHAPGPTQATLDRLVRGLTAVAVGLCLGYVALHFVRGFPAADLVQMVAATITSMVPQGLVLLATLVFVLAATRLSRRGAVVQQLAAVEGLAAVDVICTDKTGTLTTGRQTLDRVVAFAEPEAAVRGWLGAFAAASADGRNKSIEALRETLAAGAERIDVRDQLPFQSHIRCSAILANGTGEPRLFVLGSFEALASRFPESDRAAVEAAWRELLPTGLRLLAFADGHGGADGFYGRLPDIPLRPLAVVALRDKLRPQVVDVLAELAAQGIRLKVVSGDHPETVRATVRALGAAFGGQAIVTGDEWTNSTDRVALAERCDLFGRVSPEQKLALIAALQQAGHRVGMIGDGVNDVLPIKRADFGVAMGAGSQAAKAVAGLVLESNDFAVLPVALAEGRRVVQNVRLAAKLFLLKNVYTVALILVAVGVCGLPFPYLPQQVTLLNALTIGGPAAIILAGRAAGRAGGPSFFADVGRFVLTAGAATSAAGLAVYLGSLLALGHDAETARTLLLTTLILAGLGNAVVATAGDRRLIAWAAFGAAGMAAAAAVPPVAYFFALAPLTGGQWASVVIAAGAAGVVSAAFNHGGGFGGGSRSPAEGGPTPGGPAASGRPPPRG